MATVTTIEDGPRNLVLHVTGGGVESSASIVDVSALTPSCTSVSLCRVVYNIKSDQHMQLLCDATADTVLLDLYGGSGVEMCFDPDIPNVGGAGATGDILLDGGTASTSYSIYLEFRKNNVTMPR